MTQAFVESNSVRKTKTGKGNTKKISMHLLQRSVVDDNYCTGTEGNGCLLKHQEPPTPGENMATPRTLSWPITQGPDGTSPHLKQMQAFYTLDTYPRRAAEKGVGTRGCS